MLRHRKYLLCAGLSLSFLVLLLAACRRDPDVEAARLFRVPDGWPQPVYNFEGNEPTSAGFALGRRIFYDANLSRTGQISCGSCHQSFAAFANAGHIVSHGVDDKLGTRNSPPLFNLAWHPSFMWDGGVNHIENQPAAPIANPVEMDMRLDSIVAYMQRDATYGAQFREAFGSSGISSQRMFLALTQFMGAMVSSNSRYDKYLRGESGGAMSSDEIAGMQLFQQHCNSCHKAPLFSDFSFRSNGLPASAVKDSGLGHITGIAADNFKFKVPSLRNLQYTAPYMHDGRFHTLDEVLDHYDHGIQGTATDPLLSGGIHLSATERSQLIAFLNTLNDEEFVRDSRFAEPR